MSPKIQFADKAVAIAEPIDVARLRRRFPILSRQVNGGPLVYLDNAASAQKPDTVLATMAEVYSAQYANVHRGLHYLSNIATQRYEEARAKIQAFLNAYEDKEIIFTAGGTDAINLVAASFAGPRIKEGDEIILSEIEHHSNIVPWHFLRERQGAVIKWIPILDDGNLDLDAYRKLFSTRTRMVAFTHMSNALGVITPAAELIGIAHGHGVPVLLDGCQGAVHLEVDVQALVCDFYVFTGHKTYGPSGVGILYGKRAHLEAMRPYRGGGEMIYEVAKDSITYGAPPMRFEAGTPPIVPAIGLGAAVDFMREVGRAAIIAHERQLLEYATRHLSEIDGLVLYGDVPNKGAIISFTMKGAHPHDISTVVDQSGVALRAGHHCAQVLMGRLGVSATARISFAAYNTFEEIDRLVDALWTCRRMFS
jgi:cysteine desulfurase/selenocysteine lyase